MTTRRVTITVPEELLDAIREHVGEREMSAYATAALTRQVEIDRMSELVDWLEGEYGAVTESERERARRRLEEIERLRAERVAGQRRPGVAA